MKPRWMLVAFATVVTSPALAQSQNPEVAWLDAQHAPNQCVVPNRQMYSPFGEPLEPGVVYVGPPFECSDSMIQTAAPQLMVAEEVTPAAMNQLRNKVRELELRVVQLEAQNQRPSGP